MRSVSPNELFPGISAKLSLVSPVGHLAIKAKGYGPAMKEREQVNTNDSPIMEVIVNIDNE
jgi:hypothetical protein